MRIDNCRLCGAEDGVKVQHDGMYRAYCSMCGYSYFNYGKSSVHQFGEWELIETAKEIKLKLNNRTVTKDMKNIGELYRFFSLFQFIRIVKGEGIEGCMGRLPVKPAKELYPVYNFPKFEEQRKEGE